LEPVDRMRTKRLHWLCSDLGRAASALLRRLSEKFQHVDLGRASRSREDCAPGCSNRALARRATRRIRALGPGSRSREIGQATHYSMGRPSRPAFAGASTRTPGLRKDRGFGARADRVCYADTNVEESDGKLGNLTLGKRPTLNAQRPTQNSEDD
jgi:hypothetical protein